jgi:hypothetical protein
MRITDKVQLTVGHVTSVENKHDWLSGQTTITTRFLQTAYHAERPQGEPDIEALECGVEGCESVVGVSVRSRESAEHRRYARYATAWTFLISGLLLFAFVFTGGASEYEYTIGLEPFVMGATLLTFVGIVLFFWAAAYTGVRKTHDRGHLLQVDPLP